MYSYDHRKVASFQDRFKGSFECIVWINDFTIAKDKTITISGTITLYISGGDAADIKFSEVTLKKKAGKWLVVSTGAEVAESLLGILVERDGKTSQELDRLQTMK